MKYLLILILVLFCFQRSYSASRWKEVNISDLKISIPFNWSEQKLILRNNEYRFWSEDRLLLLRIYILNNKSNLKDIIDDINRKMINRKSGLEKLKVEFIQLRMEKLFMLNILIMNKY